MTRDLDLHLARMYRRPDLLDRPSVNYDDSPIFVMRDGEALMITLAENNPIFDTPAEAA